MRTEPLMWSESFRVRASETDARGRASIPAICNWLQEVAGNHATALDWAVDQLTAQGMTWVLSRLRLVLARAPRWREEVRVTTWPGGVQRAWAFREFQITGREGEELGRGTSAWLLLKLATRRPVRPPAPVEEI